VKSHDVKLDCVELCEVSVGYFNSDLIRSEKINQGQTRMNLGFLVKL
jgi:hypothetical protein